MARPHQPCSAEKCERPCRGEGTGTPFSRDCSWPARAQVRVKDPWTAREPDSPTRPAATNQKFPGWKVGGHLTAGWFPARLGLTSLAVPKAPRWRERPSKARPLTTGIVAGLPVLRLRVKDTSTARAAERTNEQAVGSECTCPRASQLPTAEPLRDVRTRGGGDWAVTIEDANR